MTKKKRTIWTIAILLLGCTVPAFAERDGYLLLRYCSATVNQLEGNQAEKDQLPDDFSCLVYIAGFTDALKTASSAEQSDICVPANKIELSARVFVDYAREHPECLHLSAGEALALALRHAFPCPAK